MSGFNAYDQALASVLSQAAAGGVMPSMEYDKKFSLFCQNLPFSVSEDEIYQTFPQSVNVTLILGDDNRPRGSCVVYFASAQQCDDVMNQTKMSPIVIKGRSIRINYNNGDNKTATPSYNQGVYNSAPKQGGYNTASQSGGFNAPPQSGGFNSRSNQGQGRQYQKNDYSNDRSQSGGYGNRSQNPGSRICMTVFNLPYASRENEIQSKFVAATRVFIKKGPDGRSKGIAVIYFDQENDLNNAMNDVFKLEINGRQLRAEMGDQTSGGGGGYNQQRGNEFNSGGGSGYSKKSNDYNNGGGYQQRGNNYDSNGNGGYQQRGNDYNSGGYQQKSNEYGHGGGGRNAGTPDSRNQGNRDFKSNAGYQGGNQGGGPRGGDDGWNQRDRRGGNDRGAGRFDNRRGGGGDRGGFRGGQGGQGGNGRAANRDRSPVEEGGKKSKYGMGSITSAIVKQLPSSGRPMSSSSESDSE